MNAVAANPVHAVTDPDTEDEVVTLADLLDSVGTNPDPTGDYAAGRVRFFASDEEWRAHLESQPYESDSD